MICFGKGGLFSSSQVMYAKLVFFQRDARGTIVKTTNLLILLRL